MIRILPSAIFYYVWGTADGKIYFLLNRRQSANLLADAKYFFNAYSQPCKFLIHSVLQSFTERQKFVRGDRQGTLFLQRN